MARELTPTGWSILGFLSLQQRSGYEIKQAAERSVGMFWGISDPQLYPQLRQLADAGLIEPAGPPETSRARQRWRLTDEGRTHLHRWLSTAAAPLQMRDEGLVKIMFGDQLGTDALMTMLRHRRAEYAELLRALQQIVPGAHRPVPDDQAGLRAPGLVHRYGLEFVTAQIRWCDDCLHALAATDDAGADDAREPKDATHEGDPS